MNTFFRYVCPFSTFLHKSTSSVKTSIIALKSVWEENAVEHSTFHVVIPLMPSITYYFTLVPRAIFLLVLVDVSAILVGVLVCFSVWCCCSKPQFWICVNSILKYFFVLLRPYQININGLVMMDNNNNRNWREREERLDRNILWFQRPHSRYECVCGYMNNGFIKNGDQFPVSVQSF